MELQWSQWNCASLRWDLRDVQNLEQTQDVHLSDGMPDVGRVLCAWGQPVLRSKEWKRDSVQVAGGINTWVLYMPEDGAEPQCVEVWLPFQARWNLPDGRKEGVVRVGCSLRSVDARSLSPRKIMVRGSVGLLAEVMTPTEHGIGMVGEVPDGVQVLRRTYPVLLPKEAGEKQFQVEEDFALQSPHKILCCQERAEITEENVIGSRVVFRGICHVKLLYLTEDGRILCHRGQIPFAQYADLDHDYDKDATLSVLLAESNLEADVTENGIFVKCGLIAQYVVYGREILQTIEDAYSVSQDVTPMQEILHMPMVLDRVTQVLEAEESIQCDVAQVVDASFLMDQPTQFRTEHGVATQLEGCFQVLYYDTEGQLQCKNENWSGEWSSPMDEQAQAQILLCGVGQGDYHNAGDGIHVTSTAKLEAVTVSDTGYPMVMGLNMGQLKARKDDDPSLILCRLGENSLWELAKQCGSTVDEICKANQLEGEPEAEQILLIPIL